MINYHKEAQNYHKEMQKQKKSKVNMGMVARFL